MRRRLLPLVAVALAPAMAMAGCVPTFERRPSGVDGPRILAVRAEPAEAAPGEAVVVRALVVDRLLPRAGAPPRWAFCLKAPAVADYNTVAEECLQQEAPWIRPVPEPGDAVRAVLPPEGCRIFGSEVPPPPPNQPPLRPADPDASGGYYQPVRISADDGSGQGPAVGFGRLRIRCALAQASADVFREYRDRYRDNQNPALTALELEGGPREVLAGQRIRLVARRAADAAEPYVAYDPQTRGLAERVEPLRLAWFATGGTLDRDAADGSAEESDNHWVSPLVPGPVWLWAVLRDDRGGVSWRELKVEVR